MSHVIKGRSYEPRDIVRAIQKHLGLQGDLDLMGQVTHVFRFCLQWQHQTRQIPYTWKQPHQDYEAYYYGGELSEAAMRYFLEVVEPTLHIQKASAE